MKQTSEALRDLITVQKLTVAALHRYRLDMSAYYGVGVPHGLDVGAKVEALEKEIWNIMQVHIGRLMEETDRRNKKLPGKKCTPEMMANIKMTRREPLA